ncbi:MAG TPA: glycosyltransferase 87 family protein [Candidatus Limnocylindria bacterium]|nr:glycosyltransferase 87 family protein [Candidatus Limnocylindria bacterium]
MLPRGSYISLGRLRDPRRLAAALLLGLTGGIILAFLYARGELAGADAVAYWAAVRTWLDGGNYYAPAEPFMPYAYAPWTLYFFAPWALLPWSVAWFIWRAASVALFAWSVAWAYERRPLATALLVAALGAPLAANLDTGNVGLLLVVGIFAAQFAGPRLGGGLWAVAAAMKWLPGLLIFFLPPRARLWGVALLAVAAVLTLATWPLTLQQIEVALFYPRPPRIDYLLLAWGAVPWLWTRDWRASLPDVRRRLPRSGSEVRREVRAFFGYG